MIRLRIRKQPLLLRNPLNSYKMNSNLSKIDKNNPNLLPLDSNLPIPARFLFRLNITLKPPVQKAIRFTPDSGWHLSASMVEVKGQSISIRVINLIAE